MVGSRCCIISILLVLLCRSGVTFVHRANIDYRLSFARLDSLSSYQNSSSGSGLSPPSPSSPSPVFGAGSAPRVEPFASNSIPESFASSSNNGRSSYRNSGSEVPLTVSSSMGSHSYRENRPSSEKEYRDGRDRDRVTGDRNNPRMNKERSSGNTPYRGRSSRSPSTGGPDVIFSSGYDSNRNNQRGPKESFDSRDNRDFNSQKGFNKPWKSRRPFDPAQTGIDQAQDYPSSSYRTIVYDHLAVSSLEAIEALPLIKFSKGRTYLSKWWQAAKKWNLLCDDLKEMDAAFLSKASGGGQKQPSQVSTAKQEAEARMKAESERISEVLSLLIRSESLSETVRTSISSGSEESPVNAKKEEKGADFLKNIASSEFLKLGSKRKESSAESKINDLIDKTIENVISIDSLDAILEDSNTIFSGDFGSESGIRSAESLEDSQGALDAPPDFPGESEFYSSNSNSKSYNKFSEKKRIEKSSDRGSESNSDDDTMRGSERDNTYERTYDDVSVPFDELYDLCDTHKARVICIGDVHGCVEELKDLLRVVKYRPGDLVLLLGDLVAKGPSSADVVRLAMDIGALSVRGNHDHEVVRQGLKFRQRGAETFERDNREARREREREANSINSTGSSSGSSTNSSNGSNNSNSSRDMNKDSNSFNRSKGGNGNGSSQESGGPKSSSNRIQQHLELGMQLSVKELSWLAELPFYIRSADLGCVFVHAGFKAGKKLNEQDPWVMMTVRSLLPDGRMSPRCFNRHPWANKWKGPLTAYFGHDAARGLQMYDCAVGLDTGCVYGGHLSAVLLPEKKFVQVPARKTYQPYGKSRSHKMYAWSNDNDTDTEPTQSELELYEFSSPFRSNGTNTTSVPILNVDASLADIIPNQITDYSSKPEMKLISNLDITKTDENPLFIEVASDKLSGEQDSVLSAVDDSDGLSIMRQATPTPPVTPQPSETSDLPTPTLPLTPASFMSKFADSPLALEIAAALAAPNPKEALFTAMSAKVSSERSASKRALALVDYDALDPGYLSQLLLSSTKSMLSGSRIEQKIDEYKNDNKYDSNGNEDNPSNGDVKKKNGKQSDAELEMIKKEQSAKAKEYIRLYEGKEIEPPSYIMDILKNTDPSRPKKTNSENIAAIMKDKSFEKYSEQLEEIKKMLDEPSGADFDQFFENWQKDLQRRIEIAGANKNEGISGGNTGGLPGLLGAMQEKFTSIDAKQATRRHAIDLLLFEFLTKADIGDANMVGIVQRGLYEVLLVEFGTEGVVLDNLRQVLATEDYLRSDVGRALHALAKDLAKMESMREGSCDSYISAARFAGNMAEAKLIELIRVHGSEADLPDFNKKRKPPKEEYIAIILRLLTIEYADDLVAVSKYLQLESLIPVKKGFGTSGVGFGSGGKKNTIKS